MPTTLPLRAAARRRPDPTIILICLALWGISLAILSAQSGRGDGDVVPALMLASP